MIRPILEAHHEAFRGSWDFREATENDFTQMVNDPMLDTSMWKIAWAGDTIVGQVKSFINVEENVEMGYLRGYTEYISTHVDWRNKGIAGALLGRQPSRAQSVGMTEAALGVDTENPGGVFQLYTKLGFELRCVRSGVRQAVDLKQWRIWSDHDRRKSCSSVSNRVRMSSSRTCAGDSPDALAGRGTRQRLDQGAPLAWMQDICRYWGEQYDWRDARGALNASPSSSPRSTASTSISSTRARRTRAPPLVITHGWPGSIVEFHKVIEPLTNPTAHRR